MNRKPKKYFIILMALFAIIVTCVPIFCETAENDEAIDYEYAKGIVLQKTAKNLSIRYFDEETSKNVKFNFIVNSKTEFENVKSLADIQIGKKIDVTYIIQNKLKVAIDIVGEEPLSNSEDEANDESSSEDEEPNQNDDYSYEDNYQEN
ncbi:hypothetical protein ACFL2K_01255 [Candidatus Margulisiibacteriota bacterium]